MRFFFNDFGLGDKEENLPFYSYIQNNDGASSFLKEQILIKPRFKQALLKLKHWKIILGIIILKKQMFYVQMFKDMN